MSAALKARLHKLRRADCDLLRGHVRECRQWSLYGDSERVRYDFAFTDPASGRFHQYCTEAFVAPGMTDEQVYDQIAEPSVSVIAMMLQRKCGIRQAIANQIPLSLPTAVANCRMV